MTLELLVRTGSRAGEREVHEAAVLVVGRNPLCDVRFHPELDRDVSSRHAELRVQDGKAYVVDLGSTNGTFVNGKRITAPTQLATGDEIGFGADGPKIEITLGATWETPAVGATRVSTSGGNAATPAPRKSAPSNSAPANSAPAAARPATQERVAIAVKQETRKLTNVFVGALVVVAALGGVAFFKQKQDGDARAAELAAMLARADSLTASFDTQIRQMKTTVAGLDTALLGAKRESESLRAQVAAGGNSPALRARLDAAQMRQTRLLSAAQMDYSAVSDASGKAAVLIAVEMPDGRAFSGSGFSVTSKGLIVTNRHLLRDEKGTVAKRVAVIFADSKEWLPARIVAVEDGPDLGILQIESGGSYPQVVGIEASGSAIRVGSPVAIIGYPLGTDTPMEGSGVKITARSTLGAGTISKTLKDVLQVDAYAGQGSSGSPVFDARGVVIGVVYGGATESAGRIVYAVPSELVLAAIQKAK